MGQRASEGAMEAQMVLEQGWQQGRLTGIEEAYHYYEAMPGVSEARENWALGRVKITITGPTGFAQQWRDSTG